MPATTSLPTNPSPVPIPLAQQQSPTAPHFDRKNPSTLHVSLRLWVTGWGNTTYPGWMSCSLHAVVHSYVGCWQVVENRPVCIKLLLPSRYTRRLLTVWEPFLQKWGLQVVKPCTWTQMKHEMFSLADVCSLEGCEIWWMSQLKWLESLSMSLMWPSMLQAEEPIVEIMYKSSEDVMKLPEIVIFNIFLPVIWA